MKSDLDLDQFAAKMQCHGWDVVTEDRQRGMPSQIIARWSLVPSCYAKLICGLIRCVSPAKQTWLVVGESFEAQPPAFRWNEIEIMSLESADGDAEWTNGVAQFWSEHIPIVMDVESDYDVWLLRLGDGMIIHTRAPEWEERGAVVADGLKGFLENLARTGRPNWDAV